MASKKQKAAKKAAKAVAFNPTDVANLYKNSPYLQRLIEDAELRDNVQKAIERGKSAYGRLTNGKAPHKALMEDKKLQKDLRETFEAVRDASTALTEAPKKKRRKGLSFGRVMLLGVIGGAAALVGSEGLRSKVLDTLFGKEEEFQYTPPASTAPPPSPTSTPVSSA